MLCAGPEFHGVGRCHHGLVAVAPGVVEALFGEMAGALAPAVAAEATVEWARSADLRYHGQSWEVEVPLGHGPLDRAALDDLRARFEDEHERLYGVRGQPGSPVILRAVRLAALGPRPDGGDLGIDGTVTRDAVTRQAFFAGASHEVPVRSRASLGETPEPGPMFVDEYDTTTVVPPGWTARRDAATSTIVLERAHG